MTSLSLVQALLIANAVTGFLLLALYFKTRSQQQKLVQLQQTLMLQDERFASLEQAQQSLTKSTVGMGRRIKQTEARLKKAEQRTVMPSANDNTFEQATRLVNLGASASDLVDNCGVARGEAELLVSLRRQQPS